MRRLICHINHNSLGTKDFHVEKHSVSSTPAIHGAKTHLINSPENSNTSKYFWPKWPSFSGQTDGANGWYRIIVTTVNGILLHNNSRTSRIFHNNVKASVLSSIVFTFIEIIIYEAMSG